MTLTARLQPAAPRPSLVPRPRLLSCLDQALHHPLTLITAPAGYGKTTLAAAWLQSHPASTTATTQDPLQPSSFRLHPCFSWLSLHPTDNDPHRFLANLVAALSRAQPGLGQGALALLRAGGFEPAVSALLDELAAAREQPLVVVLDDYHSLTAAPIQRAFAALLDHPPAGLHLLLISRNEPVHLPLARLRARGQLLALDAADLRFDEVESAGFLNGPMGLALPPAKTRKLAARTEGWAAALQLAALALQGRAEPEAFIAGFSGRHAHLADYLASEVFARQPLEVQTFLLHTAHLDRLCAPLCAAVTSQPASQAMLEHIQRANLFLIALDDERRWFRYHALFAEFLRARAESLGAETLAALHTCAGRWLAANGEREAAIDHLLAGGEVAAAADLIDRCAQTWMRRGEVATLLTHLRKVPDALALGSTSLSLWHGWAHTLTGAAPAAERWLDRVDALVARERPPDAIADHDLSHHLRAAIGQALAIRGTLARQRGDMAAGRALAQRALAILPDNEFTLRSLVTAHLGLAELWAGEVAQADATLDRALHWARAAHTGLVLITTLCLQANLRTERGYPHAARDLYSEALTRAKDAGLPALAVMPHTRLARLHYQWNEFSEAQAHLSAAFELASDQEPAAVLLRAHIIQARVRQAQRDVPGADEALAQAVRLALKQQVPHGTALARSWQARLSLLRGDLSAAEQWAVAAGLWVRDGHGGHAEPSRLVEEEERFTFCRFLIARGGTDPLRVAATVLAQWLAEVEPQQRVTSVIETKRLQALLAQAQGNPATAVDVLGQALVLAEPLGYLRLFVDEGAALAGLLTQISSSHPAHAYVARLLALQPQPAAAQTALPEPLNAHELAILRLLAQGLSNAAIAQERLLAVSTVRWYLKHIYQKLHVHNRTQAASQARTLHLLD